jgi:hypothetical protein
MHTSSGFRCSFKKIFSIAFTAAAVALLAPAAVSAVLHTCTGSGVTLTGSNIGSATFDDSCDNQVVTLRDCVAESVTFTTGIVDVTLVVENLDCSAGGEDNCLVFEGSLNGGSVSVKGVKHAVTGSSGGGSKHGSGSRAPSATSTRW